MALNRRDACDIGRVSRDEYRTRTVKQVPEYLALHVWMQVSLRLLYSQKDGRRRVASFLLLRVKKQQTQVQDVG